MTYTILETGILIDACPPHSIPIRRESVIVGIVPVVEDLVDDLGDGLCAVGLRPCAVVVELVRFSLGNG